MVAIRFSDLVTVWIILVSKLEFKICTISTVVYNRVPRELVVKKLGYMTMMTTNPEVPSSNPAQSRIFVFCPLTVGIYSAQQKWITALAKVLHVWLRLKVWTDVLRWLAVIRDCTSTWLKMIHDVLDANITHTGIAYANSIILHSPLPLFEIYDRPMLPTKVALMQHKMVTLVLSLWIP